MASCQPYNQDWQTSSGQETVEGDGDVLECGDTRTQVSLGFLREVGRSSEERRMNSLLSGMVKLRPSPVRERGLIKLQFGVLRVDR